MMSGYRRVFCGLSVAALLWVEPAAGTTVDLTSGTAGTLTGVPQSFNETRGVDATVLAASAQSLTSMTLHGLFISTASATIGARVYNSNTMALVASAQTTVSSGSNLSVMIPISATLAAGSDYRLAFFVNAGGVGGSGTMFDPDPSGSGGFPYTESTGILDINQAYSIASDSFPTGSNLFVPRITAVLCPTQIDLTSGTSGSLTGGPQSFNETRAASMSPSTRFVVTWPSAR